MHLLKTVGSIFVDIYIWIMWFISHYCPDDQVLSYVVKHHYLAVV